MQIVQQDQRPGMWRLFRLWAAIGLQSFGGGASTTFLMQRTFIDQHHWLTLEEYAHMWNLSVFAPGINLVAMTILIGRKLGGLWGIVVSLAGMLLPSATITCLLTAGFLQIAHLATVQAILNGIIPATAGIMLLVGLRFSEPQLKIARQEGWFSVLSSVLLILGCALAIIVVKLSVIIVLPVAGLLGIVLFTRPLHVKHERARKHD